MPSQKSAKRKSHSIASKVCFKVTTSLAKIIEVKLHFTTSAQTYFTISCLHFQRSGELISLQTPSFAKQNSIHMSLHHRLMFDL
jgi:hypothetical protein